MEVRRVEGNDLVKNCVYNIYQNEGNVNVGVCLVIGENNRNNRNNVNIRLRKLIGNDELSLIKSEIYGKKPVDLFRANLTGAVLTNVDLTGAVLNFSNLTSADLTDANLTGADLSRIVSGKIKGNPILPSRYVLINGYIIGPNVILTGADLTDSNLTGAYLDRIVSGKIKGNPILPFRYVLINGYIIGPNVILTGADLTGADLTGADLTGADLTRAVLTGADLTESDLNRIKSGKIKGNPILPSGYVLINGFIIGPNVNLVIDDLTNANLTDAVLTGANLTRTVLTGANLTNAYLQYANLTRAFLTGADLTGAHLTNADLTDADLTGANLYRIISGKIKGNPILPSRYVLINGFIIGPNVNLAGDDLTNANLTSAVLTGANLTGAVLTGADLTGADLTSAVLTGAVLTGADLTGADLTESDLNRIKSGKIKGNPILPSGYVLINGFIIGPNVNLVIDDLTNANLTDAVLTGANLTRTVLTGANLTNANLTRAFLTRAFLTGAVLTGAVLTGAVLTGADLTGANLTNAYLQYANLTRAVLTGADLTDADLTDAIIFRNQLSEEQRRKIIGQPNYIEQSIQNQKQQYFNINKELSNGNRISKHNGKKLENTNTKTQHRISFTRLFDFLLQEANQNKIARRFRIGGEEGFDDGGITLTIFQKCYEVFMERYFYPYEAEDNSNYVVLKDLSHEQFKEFEKACTFMILMAKKIKKKLDQPFQILIPINFLLFQVLIFEGNPEKFFELGNKNKFFGKKENGSYSNQHKLNNPFNYIAKNSINNTKNSFSIQRMYEGKYNNNQNSSKEFISKNRINNTKNNFSIQRIYEGKYNNNNPIKFNDFSEVEQQKLMFLMLLEQNHIHRRSHYETMKKFIDEIFKPNKKYFTTEIDYSYEAFVKRLKFKLSGESSYRNLESFTSLEIASNPLIQLLLEYIQVSNDYRMVMTSYVCGSFCYTGDIKILILISPSEVPFQSHTCSKELWVYITPTKQNAFNWVLKQNTTNKNNIFSPIEKLYNVFLDRTTQIM